MIASETLENTKIRNLQRYRVIVWDSEGVSKSEIARRLSIDRKEIYRVIEKFESHGSVEIDLRQANSGRPPTFDEDAKEEVRNLVFSNESMHLDDLRMSIEDELDIKASTSTVSRVLDELGKFATPTWTPLLTQNHIDARLKFCKEHVRRNTAFQNVIFTDESRFYVNRKTKKVFVLSGEDRPQRTKYNPDFSIMVWGAICSQGTIYLEVVEGTLNHQYYIEILGRFAEEVKENFSRERPWRFQQGGAPAHRPKAVREFLTDNGFKTYIHPPNSPDLNPIEMVWGWMKQFVERRGPGTDKELEDLIFEA